MLATCLHSRSASWDLYAFTLWLTAYPREPMFSSQRKLATCVMDQVRGVLWNGVPKTFNYAQGMPKPGHSAIRWKYVSSSSQHKLHFTSSINRAYPSTQNASSKSCALLLMQNASSKSCAVLLMQNASSKSCALLCVLTKLLPVCVCPMDIRTIPLHFLKDAVAFEAPPFPV